MDYQCLFANDVGEGIKFTQNPDFSFHREGPIRPKQVHHNEIPGETQFYAGYTSSALVRTIRLMRFNHIKSLIDVEDNILASGEAVQKLESPELSIAPGLRLLLSPPREDARDGQGRLRQYNPAAPLPFDIQTFHNVVDTLRFHKACLRSLPGMHPELGQISKISGPDGLTAFYAETYSYRRRWHKIYVSYAPKTMTSSIFLHNLSVDDTRSLVSKLLRPSIQPLTIHPMLIPVLVYEFTFETCHKELYRIFDRCIALYQTLGLTNNRAFSHFKVNEADDSYAAGMSFGDGQSLCALEERMDFSIIMGKRMLSYFDDLEHKTPDGDLKGTFIEAGSIIRTRLEYLIDSLELQLPRLRRAKAHTQLNRIGLENRGAAQSNKIQYQIAVESRADSSSMKAIALLTMLFLPGTFVSAIFGMPMFNWDAERERDVVSHRFWIYWAVTVPGTLAVLIVWRLWWVFDEWRVRREEEGRSVWGDVLKWVRTWGKVEAIRRGLEREEDGKVVSHKAEKDLNAW